MSGFDDLGHLTSGPALYRHIVFPFFAKASTNTRLQIYIDQVVAMGLRTDNNVYRHRLKEPNASKKRHS
jgi:hypothetical protein